MADLAADRRVGQSRRRPCQHEPRQHVGLELLQLVRRRRHAISRRSRTAASANLCLHLFIQTARRSLETIWLHDP